ncbi:MAG: hypothetical protein ACP5G4_09305, partial [bacterium]
MRYLIITIIASLLFMGCAGYYHQNRTQTIEPIEVKSDVGPGFYRVTEATGLYESADLGSRKIKSVKAGEIIEIVDVAGVFAQVKYSENAGWILEQ